MLLLKIQLCDLNSHILGGSNKLVKICHEDGKYGFSSPYQVNLKAKCEVCHRIDILFINDSSI